MENPPKPITPKKVPQLEKIQLKVSFTLPSNHSDKYGKAYRQFTPNCLQLTGENTQWKQSPVIKNWRERSCSKVREVTLPTTLHNNQFALLASKEDNEDKPMDLALLVLNHTMGKTLEHRQLQKHPANKETWDKSYAYKLGCLCQGIGSKSSNSPPTSRATNITTCTPPQLQRVAGTSTMQSIMFHKIPPERVSDVAHTRVVCKVRPTKDDPNRTRITIKGNTIAYLGNTGTKTGSLELVKGVLNSVCSQKKAKFLTADLENFYLETLLDCPEYSRICIAQIPQEFINKYSLEQCNHNGWVYFKTTKGIYGLKQAGKLANDLLTKQLSAHGYYQCATMPGLWRHKWRPILFALIVDDFSIEYVEKIHAEHLLTALHENYNVTTDWTGSKFAGTNITWDYTAQTC
jgi:hypothetical protein